MLFRRTFFQEDRRQVKQMNQTMMRRLISIGMLLVLIVLFTILAGAGKGKFLSFDNLIEIVRDASIPAIVVFKRCASSVRFCSL